MAWLAIATAVLAILVIAIVFGGIVYRRVSGKCRSNRRLDGKTVVVTGASAGIGLATAECLAQRGARVILACRDPAKAQRVAGEIRQSVRDGKGEVVVMKLDLSDFDSVREFAKEFTSTEKRLDVLINNAGVGIPDKRLSKQGLELTIATNHFGHFLLTNLLAGMLKASAPSRVVNVSSVAHFWCKDVDFTDLNFDKTPYFVMDSYANSKFCNVVFSNELARKLEGTGVVSNSLHPGAVATEIFNKENTWLGATFFFLVNIAGKTKYDGAQTSLHLAVADETAQVSGKYFEDCKEKACVLAGRDEARGKKLWELSEAVVKLQPSEMLL